MANSFVYYVTVAVHGTSTPWGFGLYVNVVVRGQRLPSVYPHVMLTPRPSFFQRSPHPFQLFRSCVNREGLGSEASPYLPMCKVVFSWVCRLFSNTSLTVIHSSLSMTDPSPSSQRADSPRLVGIRCTVGSL